MTKHVDEIQDGILVVFVDAAFGVRTDNASQGGYLIVHTHKDILDGKKCKYSVVSWKSYKLQRVVRSSLGAEAQAMAAAMEELYFVKLFMVMLLTSGTICTARSGVTDEDSKRGGDGLQSIV